MLQEKSSGIIVFREQNNQTLFLLLHYIKGHWDFPKGHIEDGETELDAAKRETEEETGITDLLFFPKFRERIKYHFLKSKKEGISTKTVDFFLAKTAIEKIRISSEHLNFKWLNFEEAQKQLTFKNAKELLKNANNFIKQKID